jgi:hypothetical protein
MVVAAEAQMNPEIDTKIKAGIRVGSQSQGGNSSSLNRE